MSQLYRLFQDLLISMQISITFQDSKITRYLNMLTNKSKVSANCFTYPYCKFLTFCAMQKHTKVVNIPSANFVTAVFNNSSFLLSILSVIKTHNNGYILIVRSCLSYELCLGFEEVFETCIMSKSFRHVKPSITGV